MISPERFIDPDIGLAHHSLTGVKAAILDATRRCAMRFGPAKTSIQDVAKIAGVSRAAVYLHYQDKEMLIGEVLNWSFTNYMAMLRAAIDKESVFENQIVAAVLAARTAYDAGRDSVFLADIRSRQYSLDVDRIVTTMNALMPAVAAAARNHELREELGLAPAAEWIARAVHSISLTPGVTFDSADAAQVEEFCRSLVVPGVLAPSATVHPSPRRSLSA
jgi:AcrR family transcriptional regulator